MNETNAGWGGVGGFENWDMKEKRENKSPSEEDDASWLEKQQGILSLSLPLFPPFLILAFLSLLFFLSVCHFSALCRDSVHVNALHTRMHIIIFWITYIRASKPVLQKALIRWRGAH